MVFANECLPPGEGACFLDVVPKAEPSFPPKSYRFLKSQRLLKSKEFAEVLKSGKRQRGAYFTAVWLPALGGASRLGVVVSRKLGKANRRNRLKRICREWFRSYGRQMKEPLDLVIIPRATLLELDYEKRLQVFEILRQQLGQDPH